MIAPDHYPIVRHAELVRRAELEAEIRRHPERIVARRRSLVRRRTR